MNSNFDAPPPALSPLLDEFRSALQDEIEVASRNTSHNAIPLRNGHKISGRGSAHQYAFLIDSVLNTPDGAPGDLKIPGKAPIGVTILSVEGLRIVVSVESDLGKFVPNARLQTNLTILMRKLIQRIEDNATTQNPAADRMLGNEPVEGSPIRLAHKLDLNESQLNALRSALTQAGDQPVFRRHHDADLKRTNRPLLGWVANPSDPMTDDGSVAAASLQNQGSDVADPIYAAQMHQWDF